MTCWELKLLLTISNSIIVEIWVEGNMAPVTTCACCHALSSEMDTEAFGVKWLGVEVRWIFPLQLNSMSIVMDDSCDLSVCGWSLWNDHTYICCLSVGEIHSDDVKSCAGLQGKYEEVLVFLTHVYVIQILMDRNVESLYILKSSPSDASGYKAVQVTPVCVVLSVWWQQ